MATRSRSGAGWRDGDAYSQRLGEMNGAAGPGRSLPRPWCRRRACDGSRRPRRRGALAEIGGWAFFGSRRCGANCITERGKAEKEVPPRLLRRGGSGWSTTVLGVSDRMDRVGLLPEGQHDRSGDQIGTVNSQCRRIRVCSSTRPAFRTGLPTRPSCGAPAEARSCRIHSDERYQRRDGHLFPQEGHLRPHPVASRSRRENSPHRGP